MMFGGLITALEYIAAGLVLCLTIIGIPFGLQAFKLGMLCLWPFGSHVENSSNGDGCLDLVFNVIWFFCGGIWICLTHFFHGCLLSVTIIGIPWGKMHFRMAGLALSPFGKTIV